MLWTVVAWERTFECGVTPFAVMIVQSIMEAQFSFCENTLHDVVLVFENRLLTDTQ